jgi:oligopeptide transport system substrate-binding protein
VPFVRPLGIAALASWLLVAVVSGSAISAGALRRAVLETVTSLDPQQALTAHNRLIARDLFEGLVTLDADRRPIPGAAARWDILDGGRTYVFHLRTDGRWSDGRTVTAANFVEAFQRLAARGSAWGRLLLADVVKGGAVTDGPAPPTVLGVEAVDDLTLRIRLVRPQGSLIAFLADVALSPVHNASHDGGPMPSNGPYRVVSWSPRAPTLKLERNPFYHGAEGVPIGEVDYIPMPRGAARLAAYKRGEVDTVPVADRDLAWVRENLPDELQGPDIPAGAYLMIGARGPLARQAEMRLSLSLALDREALTNVVSPPGLRPMESLLPASIGGHEPGPGPLAMATASERQARAREIMTRHTERGEPLTGLRLCEHAPGPSRQQLLAIALMWHLTFGLDVKVAGPPPFGLDNCDLWASTIHADIADPLTFLTALAAQEAGGAEEFFQLLSPARAEGDPVPRKELLRDAELAALRNSWIIPLWQDVSDVLVKPRVSGWRAADPYLPTRFLSTRD